MTNLFIVVSTKNNQGYFKKFETREAAERFLNTEEYDFRERELFDMSTSDAEEFKEYYCYTPEDGESDEELERQGWFWDEFLNEYCKLSDRTDEI